MIPIWQEPLPGWTDNINGPTGLLIGMYIEVIATASNTWCPDNREFEVLGGRTLYRDLFSILINIDIRDEWWNSTLRFASLPLDRRNENMDIFYFLEWESKPQPVTFTVARL